MTLNYPRSLQSWLFSAGVVFLLLMALLYAMASILAAHEQARAPNGGNLGVAATWLMFEIPVWILDFAGFSCLILAALVSIFRSILPSKSK
jgi:hypothetical protein